LLLAAAFPAALGCEAILGLDGYRKVADAGDADVQDAGDDRPVLFVDASPASRWARWIMPNARPPDGGPPDGGPRVPNEAVYQMTRAGLCDGGTVDAIQDVTDGGPNLVWLLDVVQRDSLVEARSYCASLCFRLPTRIELVSILDAARSGGPRIPPEFGSSSNGLFWTDSPVLLYPSGATQVWAVDFGSGHVIPSSTTGSKNFVRCVTGGVNR
jgi:hypothetical protein